MHFLKIKTRNESKNKKYLWGGEARLMMLLGTRLAY
jgi:hypothetical protein